MRSFSTEFEFDANDGRPTPQRSDMLHESRTSFHLVDIGTLMCIHIYIAEEKVSTIQCICSNVKCNCNVNLARAQVHTGIILVTMLGSNVILLSLSPSVRTFFAFILYMCTILWKRWLEIVSFELVVCDLIVLISLSFVRLIWDAATFVSLVSQLTVYIELSCLCCQEIRQKASNT